VLTLMLFVPYYTFHCLYILYYPTVILMSSACCLLLVACNQQWQTTQTVGCNKSVVTRLWSLGLINQFIRPRIPGVVLKPSFLISGKIKVAVSF
jgi:hypothetical protein